MPEPTATAAFHCRECGCPQYGECVHPGAAYCPCPACVARSATAICRFCNERPAVVGGACGTCDEKLLDGLADHFGETRAPKCPVTVYTPQDHKCDRPLPCPVHGNPVRL